MQKQYQSKPCDLDPKRRHTTSEIKINIMEGKIKMKKMNKKRVSTRLLSLALVLLMAFAATVPAMAAENLTIVIKNNEGLPSMENNQFYAFQLFSGTPNKEESVPSPNPNVTENAYNATNWNNYTLADIQWGSGVDGDRMLGDLKTLTFSADNEKWSEFFDGQQQNVFVNVSSAADLANLLVGKKNAFLQMFCEFVVHGKDKDHTHNEYLVESAAVASTVTQGETDEKDTSAIDVTAQGPGYYLVVEKDLDNKYNAVSEFILAVLGDQEIDLKASVPTVDKNILEGNNGDKGDVAGIGDTVKFELTGTLPKDFVDYGTYYYAFKDTLSKGLTFDAGSIVVTVVRAGFVYTIDPDGNEYQVTSGASAESPGSTDITVEFTDLRKSGIKYTAITKPDGSPVVSGDQGYQIPGTMDIGSNDVIKVTYTAKLNDNAVAGFGSGIPAGNPNDVKLEYSNNPNEDSRGETPQKTVYVYTFGLDLTKTDGDKSEGLEGAGFVLKNANGQYARFSPAEGGLALNVWVEAATADPLIQAYKDAKKAYNSASSADSNAKLEELNAAKEKLSDYLLTSAANGKIPNVFGLDEGTYTLTEVVTPDGYNTMKDFTFKIKAAIDPNTGLLTKVDYYTPENAGVPTKTYDNNNDVGIFQSGLIPQTLENLKAPSLPFTGGVGRLIICVLGGTLIAGAMAYIMIKAKKRRMAEDNA